MDLLQHVYGRVAKGYTGGSPGYQLAALSDGLATHSEVVEKMNQLSFFHFREGTGKETRYSFYRPAPGYLAFGCSCWARDRMRTVGAFAHHFVCREDEFIRTALSPVALLQALKPCFFESEEKLPDRTLPAIRSEDLTIAELPVHLGRPPELILGLLEFLRGSPTAFTPVVPASEATALQILGDLYSRLHRPRIAELTFSTLFVEATDFATAFRLVFVPEHRHIPTGTTIYRVFDPEQPPRSTSTRVAFANMWAMHPEQANDMVQFFNMSHLAPGNLDEAAPLIDSLLATGKLFRDSFEQEKVPASLLMRLLLANPARATRYLQTGAPLPYSAFRSAVWEDPAQRLPTLLLIASSFQDARLRDEALLDSAKRIADGQRGVCLIELLESADAEAFFRQACSMSDTELRSLAEVIPVDRRLPILVEIASRIIRVFPRGRYAAEGGMEHWLALQCQSIRSAGFPQAAVDFISWHDQRARSSFRIRNYRLDSEQYQMLLELAWALYREHLRAADLIDSVFHDAHRDEFFSFIVRQFPEYKLQDQAEMLQAIIICRPRHADYHYLIDAINRASSPRELAQFLREQVQRLAPDAEGAIRQLQAIERRSSWNPFRR